jgi:hypothetical protein
MLNSLGKTSAVLVLALFALSAGVMAADPISTIAPGNVVFLGEEGLDITAAMEGDTQIGWWASAASISSSSPSYTIVVSNPNAFFISETEFAGKLGPWYHLNAAGKANGTAFTVVDPNLEIRVYDATVGVDATANGWITSGDEVEFRITTNLNQMTQRAGVPAVPIRIHVQGPDGATYSALVNRAGDTTSIIDVPVNANPYSTGPIWDTNRHDSYPYGSYTIWAECNVNSMKDNYGYSGKTYTSDSGLLNQGANPLITANTGTTAATAVATSAATSVPTTTPTSVPTTVTTAATVVTTAPTAPPTTLLPPPPTTAKSPGFGSALAASALLIALACIVRKD